jgi:IstB-like ATP binding protein
MTDMPAKYRRLLDLGLLDLESEAVRQAKQNALESLIVLSGGVGAGKTSAACWWLRERARRGVAGWFMTAALLARWPRYDVGEMARLLRIDALVIDDLGTEYMDDKGNFMAILDEVIDSRTANEKQTLVTTNLGVEAFRERYKDRVADRIRESGRFLSVSAPSRRHRETPDEASRRAEAERAVAEKSAQPAPWTPEQIAEARKLRGVVRELAEKKANSNQGDHQ